MDHILPFINWLDANIIVWIEAHEVTVDLIKWIFLIFLAWITGLFGYVRRKFSKPKVSICSITSRCFIENIKDQPENISQDAERAALLLQIEVSNPRNTPIIVHTLEVQVFRKRKLLHWGPPISAISLPNRVHHTMGSGIKIMRNWFSIFDDGIPNLTIRGKIQPKDAKSGFALFVTSTWGSWNARVIKEHIHVQVTAGLATGEKYKGKGYVPVNRDEAFFESLVPGIIEHIRHPTANNVPVRFSKKHFKP